MKKNKVLVASIAILIGSFTLAGCCGGYLSESELKDSQKREQEYIERNIRIGKLCKDNGGTWTQDNWNGGYRCEFV